MIYHTREQKYSTISLTNGRMVAFLILLCKYFILVVIKNAKTIASLNNIVNSFSHHRYNAHFGFNVYYTCGIKTVLFTGTMRVNGKQIYQIHDIQAYLL